MNKGHSRTQGDLCESIAAFYYTSKGYVVSKPLNHSKYYDLIIDNGENIFRVECKSSSSKTNNTSYSVSLVTNGGNQSWNRQVKRIASEHTDIVFIIDGDLNMYEYSSEELIGRKSVNVNSSLPSYIGNAKI